MSITTKTGDKGMTALYRGKRVAKDSLRIEICGELDELNSYLGFSKNLTKGKKIKKIIESIQKDLFVVGAEVATEIKFINKLKQRIDSAFINHLEAIISQIEKKNPLAEFCFCLPGKNLASGSFDISQNINHKEEIINKKEKKILLANFCFCLPGKILVPGILDLPSLLAMVLEISKL